MGQELLVATRKGLFTLARPRRRGRWSVARAEFLGDNASVVLRDRRDGWTYVALGHGHFGVKFHRSPDGGATWEEAAAPAYPPRPEGVEPETDGAGKPFPSSTHLIWALEPGGKREPGVLWCGTIPGGLFRSADRGASWSLVRSLWDHPKRKEWFGGGADYPGLHSICVDPRDPARLTVGVSCGGVWVSADAGVTWNCRAEGMWASYMPPDRKHDPHIQDPHRVAQCAAAPDTLWAQHHNGIFRSTDGARSWHELEAAQPSGFGFAVAAHPKDPDTAWFVPALNDERRIPVQGKVVVSRTRDGGRSFAVLRDGLPQEHAYDITYRHALDVDGRGRTLAFGTTTGSLWWSDDEGDSWRCAAANLPPIYCVRFVE